MSNLIDFSYFPGCSLATSAAESNISMMKSARILGLNLIELKDWNCCGSSSAGTLCKNLALAMAARNLSLAPPDRPLVAMCPRCLHYLRSAQNCLKNDPETRSNLEEQFGRSLNPDLEIVHFMARPPSLAKEKYFQGEMENILVALGAEPVTTGLSHRCCGSFLSATDPEVVTPLVNEIIKSAVASKANCLVTACAMCQLNLEIRATAKTRLPVFHFSEVLALALGAEDYEAWFVRHIVDPRPLVEKLARAA
ncbi:MAG: heterodisulfide reductase-related iron-sulfur binding cluster [Syntrophobacterales bacterium]